MARGRGLPKAPDFTTATRATASSQITALEKAFKLSQTQFPVRQGLAARRSGRGGRLEAKSDFKIRVARHSIAQRNRQKDIRAARLRISELNRKEKINKIVFEKEREERIFVGGPSGQALARAKKRGLGRVVSKTAARRGRGKTVVKKIAGRSCSARTSQDVGLLTAGEAACELESKNIGRRGTPTGGALRGSQAKAGRVKINEREARLIVKLAAKPSRGKKRSRSKVLEGFNISTGVVDQARAGLAPLDILNSPGNFTSTTKRIGGRTTGRLVTTRRSKFDGTSQNLLRNRSNFIFGGGTNRNFNILVSGDVQNRESGRRRVQSVSRGRVVLNRTAPFDPFLGQFIF